MPASPTRALLVLLLLGCRRSPLAPEKERPSVDSGVADGDDPVDRPGAITLQADRSALLADGQSALELKVEATWEDGRPAPASALPLAVDLGRIELIDDSAVSLIAGTWPGAASLSAPGWILSGDTIFTFSEGVPQSVQLHLHGSLSEGDAGMGDHLVEAEGQGLDVLWWTDHDYMYRNEGYNAAVAFDFEDGDLSMELPVYPPPTTRPLSWELLEASLEGAGAAVESAAAHRGEGGWRLSGVGPAETGGALSFTLASPANLHLRSLLGDLTLSIWLRPLTDDPGAELFLTIPLSARRAGSDSLPDTYRALHLVRSSTVYVDTDTDAYRPIEAPAGEWTEITVNLSDWGAEAAPTIGLDQRAELMVVRAVAAPGATVAYDLDDLSWSQSVTGTALRAAQQDLLDAAPTEIVQLVGQEVSLLDEGHFNTFGAAVPFLPYHEGALLDAETLVALAEEEGGLVSYNHMFGTGVALVDEEARAAQVVEAIATLTERRVWGCQLLEVGYRSRGGATEDFLAVWDALSVAGVFITGEGASDQHDVGPWDLAVNNLVTYVPVLEPDEAQLLSQLRRGAVWFGDPTAFPDGHVGLSLYAPSHRATMGQILVGETDLVDLSLSITWAPAGSTVVAIEDGLAVAEWSVAEDGAVSVSHTVDPTTLHALRFELRDTMGQGILFSNPMYFVSTDPGDLPAWRLPAP